MTKLSVNVNKIATLRNARGENYPNLLNTAIDILNFVSFRTLFLYFFGCLSNNSIHGTEITFEYIFSLANLWLVSIASFTSDPLAKIVKIIFLMSLVQP